MIDCLIVEGIETDAGNERKSHEKHGVTANEVSARDMHRKERAIYAQSHEEH
ncbi:MAG TPA: hypothetical protein PKC97_15625 [Burkholderiaceae bacterium]|nr:hypothetical protein [Burkholderiaceae bacterium]